MLSFRVASIDMLVITCSSFQTVNQRFEEGGSTSAHVLSEFNKEWRNFVNAQMLIAQLTPDDKDVAKLCSFTLVGGQLLR